MPDPMRPIVHLLDPVAFRDLRRGSVRAVPIVYPEEADIAAGRASVFNPVGAAPIGLRAIESLSHE